MLTSYLKPNFDTSINKRILSRIQTQYNSEADQSSGINLYFQ